MKDEKCKFGEVVISYLYGELTNADRERFEAHLLDCTACTDEFAGLAFSRFEVYEWTKKFAEVPTPVFTIPYGESPTFIEKVRYALRSGFAWPAAGAAFASIAVITGIGYFALVPATPEAASIQPVVEQRTAVAEVSLPEDEDQTSASAAVDSEVKPRQTKAVRAAATDRRPTAKRRGATAGLRRSPMNASRDMSSPRLTEFADDSDDSLRLAQLFDEIGSSE